MGLISGAVSYREKPQDDWMDKAACKGKPENTFFVGRGQKTTEAKKICNKCPVEKYCLKYAIVNNEQGIWAGTSEKDRQHMRWLVNEVEALILKRESYEDSLFNISARPNLRVVSVDGKPTDALDIAGPTDGELVELEDEGW